MGFQLAAAIGLGVVVGMKVDEYLMWEQPMGTALFGLIGLAAGMYQVLKALLETMTLRLAFFAILAVTALSLTAPMSSPAWACSRVCGGGPPRCCRWEGPRRSG